MLRSVFTKTLFDSRRAIIGWGVEFVAVVSLIVAIYPSFAHNNSLAKIAKSFPAGLTAFIGYGGTVDYGSPVGFIGTELFTLMLPLLMLAVAIGAGARAIASEEEQTTLDLLLANPISRPRLVLEKAAALLAELLVLAFALWAALAISTRIANVAIPLGRLAAAAAFVLLLAFLFGALALAVGAATGRHGLAVAVSTTAAVVAYLLNGLGPLVSWLRSVQQASPFYHYTAPAPLLRGFALGHASLLAAAAVVLVAAAVVGFDRRDLG